MRKRITPANWMKNTVTEQEANEFDSRFGQCCDPTHFRVHLGGTPANAWNKSAISVFIKDFLAVHPGYPSQEDSVRKMVWIKSHAALESMIKQYRKSNTLHSGSELEAMRLQKNRTERKRKVSPAIPYPIPRR